MNNRYSMNKMKFNDTNWFALIFPIEKTGELAQQYWLISLLRKCLHHAPPGGGRYLHPKKRDQPIRLTWEETHNIRPSVIAICQGQDKGGAVDLLKKSSGLFGAAWGPSHVPREKKRQASEQ